MMKKMIYLDNAATTALLPNALEKMLPYLNACYGNASATHAAGREARKAVELARKTIASCIGAGENSLYFTSGGTESDVTVLRGVLSANGTDKRHIVTSAVEHHAVLHTLDRLQEEGICTYTLVPVDENGAIKPEDVKRAIREDTVLVSIMHGNNETGVIMPVAEIASCAHERGCLFHTDAVQTIGHIPVDVCQLDVDFLSFSGHKFHGPKGIGGLYVKNPHTLRPLMTGGEQERNMRAGTENVAGIVGMAEALRYFTDHSSDIVHQVVQMRMHFSELIMGAMKDTMINGGGNVLPGIINFQFTGIAGEQLLTLLDMRGICASSGSACTAGSLNPSHVLTALGRTEEEAKNALRISISDFNTMDEMESAAQCLVDCVKTLRGY